MNCPPSLKNLICPVSWGLKPHLAAHPPIGIFQVSRFKATQAWPDGVDRDPGWEAEWLLIVVQGMPSRLVEERRYLISPITKQ